MNKRLCQRNVFHLFLSNNREKMGVIKKYGFFRIRNKINLFNFCKLRKSFDSATTNIDPNFNHFDENKVLQKIKMEDQIIKNLKYEQLTRLIERIFHKKINLQESMSNDLNDENFQITLFYFIQKDCILIDDFNKILVILFNESKINKKVIKAIMNLSLEYIESENDNLDFDTNLYLFLKKFKTFDPRFDEKMNNFFLQFEQKIRKKLEFDKDEFFMKNLKLFKYTVSLKEKNSLVNPKEFVKFLVSVDQNKINIDQFKEIVQIYNQLRNKKNNCQDFNLITSETSQSIEKASIFFLRFQYVYNFTNIKALTLYI